MIDYPVVFRCSECTIEHPNLELLESHIWSRHLRNFPYRCALCGYPAITHKLLVVHFKESHALHQAIEFKRKVIDEVRLREIVASSIVVPVYEEEEDIYDHDIHQQISPHNMSSSEMTLNVMNVVSNNAESVNGIQIQDQDGNMVNDEPVPLVGMEPLIYVPVDQGDQRNFNKVEVMEDVPEDVQMTVLQQHQQLMNTQHLNGGEIIPIEDGEGTSYEVYDGHDLLEEAYEYADDDGNIVYLSTGVPNATKACRELRMRMLKERHIDLVVNKVAGQRHSHRKRPLTVYECEECGKILRYPSKIEEHRRSHTGDKPHECPQCGQKFSQKGALKCHMRLHTGERPFHCTWDCGKSFVSSSALRMHEKSHSGERPFACGVCGRLFTKRSHCQRHEITVHPSESARPPIPSGLAAAGKDEDTLRDVVNGVIEEVRIERSLRANAS